jgi:hypothetical protein
VIIVLGHDIADIAETVKKVFRGKTVAVVGVSTSPTIFDVTEIPDIYPDFDEDSLTGAIMEYGCLPVIGNYDYDFEPYHYPAPVSCRIPSIIHYSRNAKLSRIIEYSEDSI